MKLFAFLLFLCVFPPAFQPQSQPQSQPQPKPSIKTGIDVLIDSDFSILKGKRVGLITNPTGITNGLKSTADVFADRKDFQLVALFGPEHGVRGAVPSGQSIDSYVDSATRVPVYSLYGKNTKPTAAMLKGIEALVYDIQDIGTRSYTYISTMAFAMEAAAENDIEFVVLDRPNPLTGDRVEGNVLDSKFKSFVGMFPIPYVYGMTCGELAQLLNEEGWIGGGKKCKLRIVAMRGWTRSLSWEETGLQWVPPSPHIPTAESALFCAAAGAMGELDALNVGVGYTMPFQLVGAPWIDAALLTKKLDALRIPGVRFRSVTYTPFYAAMKGKQVNGVQIYIVDRARVNLVNIQLYLMQTINELYPAKNIFGLSDSIHVTMFDKVMGTDAVRLALAENVPAEKIVSEWKKETDQFLTIRKKYLLYK
jgi:uncharacterized protein YbbC (DUF1343 family)